MVDILNIKENEDGSADVTLSLDEKEISSLIEIGFNKMLEEYLENDKNVDKSWG